MIYYQNVRGLRTKSVDFFTSVLTEAYPVIVLTETWLNDTFSNTILIDKRYTVYRKDRSTSTSSKSRGGGVLIAVLNTFQSEVIDYDLYSTREEIWVAIYINGSNKMLLGAVYIPPDSNTAVYEEHASFVEHLTSDYSEDIVCVVGDYNLPGLEWCVALDGNIFNRNNKIANI